MLASHTGMLWVPVHALSSSPCVSLGFLVLCYFAVYLTEHGSMLNGCTNEQTSWRRPTSEATVGWPWELGSNELAAPSLSTCRAHQVMSL